MNYSVACGTIVADLLVELSRRHIRVSARGGRLQVRPWRDVLPHERALLREHKDIVLTLLTGPEPAAGGAWWI
jgi:hypothetical protein